MPGCHEPANIEALESMNQAVGKRFPDLELPDHTGNATRLSEIAGKFPLVLVFYRGYW